MIKIGLIGKTNTGKTTFFNAATLQSAEVSTYPFTTKKPNIGATSIRALCVCRELNVKDNPKNSTCVDGWRFIPVELMDLPGLIKGSWMGKGLGIRFLSVAAEADALLHVVDASGSIDAEGKLSKPGVGNPILDVYDIEEELAMWFANVIRRCIEKSSKRVEAGRLPVEKALHQDLAGLKVRLEHVQEALKSTNLEGKALKSWSSSEIKDFARKIRLFSKPTIILANKMDIGLASKNFERLNEEFRGTIVVPCCSEAELALRRAEQKNFIKYIPGEEAFHVVDERMLTDEQKWALNYVQERVLSRLIGTGVQFAINLCVFKLLGMNVVYPVENPVKLSDKRGNVLPDAFLIQHNATIRDLAREIHSELAETMIYGVDARTSIRLPNDYILKDRDIISIVAAARKK